MNAEQFIREYEEKFLEYCPCIIASDGDILECADGHLKALNELFIKVILSLIPHRKKLWFYISQDDDL